jgi:acetoin utilization protein AcuB
MPPQCARGYLERMKDLPASKVMTRPLLTVAPGDPLGSALTLMEKQGVHHLLVVEKNRLAGILSSADLLKLAFLRRSDEAASAAGDSLSLQVRDVMQSRVAVVRENASLKDIARALSLGGFHALPVLALDDTPVGIVTSSDLVGLLIDQIDSGKADGGVPRHEHSGNAEMLRLQEVLRAAELYLQSGQSGEKHARLARAVERAREKAAA